MGGSPYVNETVCQALYAYKKNVNMWTTKVTMDAKLKTRSCDDLRSGLQTARRLRKALYSLLPLFSLKTLLYNSEGSGYDNLRTWLKEGRAWHLTGPASPAHTVSTKGGARIVNAIRDELTISEFFPDKRYKMLFGQQDVPMNKIFVGVTFIGYWEYLMDNLDQIDIGKKLTWDPCDAPSPTDNPEEYGVPLPF